MTCDYSLDGKVRSTLRHEMCSLSEVLLRSTHQALLPVPAWDQTTEQPTSTAGCGAFAGRLPLRVFMPKIVQIMPQRNFFLAKTGDRQGVEAALGTPL